MRAAHPQFLAFLLSSEMINHNSIQIADEPLHQAVILSEPKVSEESTKDR
jgi:hypothetical protein